jgi:uncharacterized OsmC-like protein
LAKDKTISKMPEESGWKKAKKVAATVAAGTVAEDVPVASFRNRQRALKDAYREDGSLARQVSAVYSVTPPDAEAGKVRIAIDSPAGVEIDIGAHASVGGTDDTGCSGDYLLAALAGCYEVTLRLVAAASGLTINRLDLRVEGDWDARGTLGLDRDVAVGLTGIRVLVNLEADGPEDRLARLETLADQFCVVTQTLVQPPQVEVTFARGGAG